MNTTVTKRSVVIAGRKTSISLEDEFWNGLKAIARDNQRTLSSVIGEIDQKRKGNLSSAIRIYVFKNKPDPAAVGARLLEAGKVLVRGPVEVDGRGVSGEPV